MDALKASNRPPRPNQGKSDTTPIFVLNAMWSTKFRTEPQTRLELIGLEERITPAVIATGNVLASGAFVLTTTAGEDITSVVANSNGTRTVSATTAAGGPVCWV